MANKTTMLIVALLLVIVVLVGVVLYAFVIKPQVSGYTVEKQQQGIDFAVVSIMQRAAQCQTVPLTYENVTLNLIAVECLQQPGQTGQAADQTAQ